MRLIAIFCALNTQSDTSVLTSPYISPSAGAVFSWGAAFSNNLGAACRATAQPPWRCGTVGMSWLTAELPVAWASQSSCKFSSKRRFKQIGQTPCCSGKKLLYPAASIPALLERLQQEKPNTFPASHLCWGVNAPILCLKCFLNSLTSENQNLLVN